MGVSGFWRFWCGAWFAVDVGIAIQRASQGRGYTAIMFTVCAALMVYFAWKRG